MDDIDKRNVFLEELEIPGRDNEYEYWLVLSPLRGQIFGYTMIFDFEFKYGYKRCIEIINEKFSSNKIPLNHRNAVNSRKLVYEYFDKISPFGFEPK